MRAERRVSREKGGGIDEGSKRRKERIQREGGGVQRREKEGEFRGERGREGRRE